MRVRYVGVTVAFQFDSNGLIHINNIGLNVFYEQGLPGLACFKIRTQWRLLNAHIADKRSFLPTRQTSINIKRQVWHVDVLCRYEHSV